MTNKRPQLNIISFKEANKYMFIPGEFIVTISKGQWDNFLNEAYFNQHATLIELDENEQPVAAYRKV